MTPGETTLSRAHSSPAVLLVPVPRDSKRKYSPKPPTPQPALKRQKLTQGSSKTSTMKPNESLPVYSPPSLLPKLREQEQDRTALGQPFSKSMLASLFAWTELSPTKKHPLVATQASRQHPVAPSPVVRTPPRLLEPTGMTPPSPPGYVGYCHGGIQHDLFNNNNGQGVMLENTRSLQPNTALTFVSASNAPPEDGKPLPTLPPIKTTLSEEMSDLFCLENTGYF